MEETQQNYTKTQAIEDLHTMAEELNTSYDEIIKKLDAYIENEAELPEEYDNYTMPVMAYIHCTMWGVEDFETALLYNVGNNVKVLYETLITEKAYSEEDFKKHVEIFIKSATTEESEESEALFDSIDDEDDDKLQFLSGLDYLIQTAIDDSEEGLDTVTSMFEIYKQGQQSAMVFLEFLESAAILGMEDDEDEDDEEIDDDSEEIIETLEIDIIDEGDDEAKEIEK